MNKKLEEALELNVNNNHTISNSRGFDLNFDFNQFGALDELQFLIRLSGSPIKVRYKKGIGRSEFVPAVTLYREDELKELFEYTIEDVHNKTYSVEDVYNAVFDIIHPDVKETGQCVGN